MNIDRKKLLEELKTVQGGLDKKEGIEQSDCFVFHKGEIMTFNDEMACRTKSSLNIEGVVHGAELLGILQKMKEDTLEVEMDEKELKIKGKGKRGTLHLEKKINLPIDDVEKPETWHKVPTDFLVALNLVKECTSNNSNSPHLICIHFTPKYIEACDGNQAARYEIETPIKKSTLIKKNSIQQLISLGGIKEISETKSWVHFKNDKGLIASCNKYVEDYPTDRITDILKSEGNSIELPKGLNEMLDRLIIFLDSKEAGDTAFIEVTLTSEKAIFIAKGAYGSFRENKKVKFKGDEMSFSISPQLLKEIIRRSNKCKVSNKVIKISLENFEYISSIWKKVEKE